MPAIEQSAVTNGLLKALTPEAFAKFAPHLKVIELPLRHVLVEANQPVEHVCFIASGLASLVATSADKAVEIGHVGREGMTGEHVALMTKQTPNRTFMQVAGHGYQLSASKFVGLLNKDVATRELFLNYVHSCELQSAQSALANGRYSLQARLSRWLLMMHDRMDGDVLPLTHDFLGLMLGARRSGVTDQIHHLEGTHAIKATRGKITIIDRGKLEELAGSSYGTPESEYRRLIGQSVRIRQSG